LQETEAVLPLPSGLISCMEVGAAMAVIPPPGIPQASEPVPVGQVTK